MTTLSRRAFLTGVAAAAVVPAAAAEAVWMDMPLLGSSYTVGGDWPPVVSGRGGWSLAELDASIALRPNSYRRFLDTAAEIRKVYNGPAAPVVVGPMWEDGTPIFANPASPTKIGDMTWYHGPVPNDQHRAQMEAFVRELEADIQAVNARSAALTFEAAASAADRPGTSSPSG